MKPEQQEMPRRGVDLAVYHAGSQGALGKSLAVRQQAISQWQRQGWVPAKRVAPLVALYPDLDPIDLMHPRIRCLVAQR